MKSILAYLLAGSLVLTAGCNKCDDVEPTVNVLQFYLLSPTGQNLVGPAATQYPPNSLSVTFQGQPFGFTVGDWLSDSGPIGGLQTQCCFIGKGQARLLLRLTSTDTDTIDITYRTKQGKCAEIIQYTKVEYNLRPMVAGEYGVYRFIKR